jgi:hypothetical protein
MLVYAGGMWKRQRDGVMVEKHQGLVLTGYSSSEDRVYIQEGEGEWEMGW